MPDAVLSETKPIVEPTRKGFRLSTALKGAAAVLLLAGLAVGGSAYYSYSSVRESTDDAQIDGHIYPVSAMVEGTMLDVLVDNNQVVQAGALLGHIDPNFIRPRLKRPRVNWPRRSPRRRSGARVCRSYRSTPRRRSAALKRR